MHYQKVHSVAKKILPRGQRLEDIVEDTLTQIAAVVGSTLGPQGRPVLIERQEPDVPPTVTKDGVTVFRSLGFQDSFRQMIMESSRDSADRVAKEAGDGTTTTTILVASIVRQMRAWVKANPHRSPQKAIRELEACFRNVAGPAFREAAAKAALDDPEGDRRLRSVARVSANGDEDLADAVMQCFKICGDAGNVTLLEATGDSRYTVEEVDGYPMAVGWEESCLRFYPAFLNESETGRCRMQNPLFILVNGPVLDYNYLVQILGNLVGPAWAAGEAPRDYVLVATRFSETVLGNLAVMFEDPSSINVVPLLVPQLPVANSQTHALEDLAAVVGAQVFDNMNHPLDQLTFPAMGAYQELNADRKLVWKSKLDGIEISRYRSTVLGHADDDELADRIAVLEAAAPEVESDIEGRLLQERIAKLSGGIARLKIWGLSNGETKEKRDRAEDAVCAVRGAIKHGILPGGGWALLRVAAKLDKSDSEAVRTILAPALREPVRVLFRNAGYAEEEIDEALKPVIASTGKKPEKAVVFDLLEHGHVDAFKAGIFDSTPAVLEAVRCSLSIAARLGGLGGLVAFGRDQELEREESRTSREVIRHISDATSTQRYQEEGIGEAGDPARLLP